MFWKIILVMGALSLSAYMLNGMPSLIVAIAILLAMGYSAKKIGES